MVVTSTRFPNGSRQKKRPVSDRRRLERLVPGLGDGAPGRLDVVDLEAEVARAAAVYLVLGEKVKLALPLARRKPDEPTPGERFGHGLLLEPENAPVERAKLVRSPMRIRRRDVLQARQRRRSLTGSLASVAERVSALAGSPNGALYIAESSNHRMRVIDSDGTISTLQVTGTQRSWGPGAPIIRALEDRVERLRGIPLFAELDDEALERVAAIATETEFPPGAVLIERGHPGLGLFVILDGTVRADVRDRHADVGPGEFVGELSLLIDRMPRAARVRAEKPVRALAISRADFLALLESEPSIAIAMLRVVATRLAHMLDAPH
jgi:hypothetical protein